MTWIAVFPESNRGTASTGCRGPFTKTTTMHRPRLRYQWMAAFALFVQVSGCGGGGEKSDEAPGERLNLEYFAGDYLMYSTSQKRPPRNLADMNILNTMLSPAMNEVRNGNIIVGWGASLPDTEEEPGHSKAPEILAYGKEVPEKGGYVLHLDRTITRMTPEEFKAAAKAGNIAAAGPKSAKP